MSPELHEVLSDVIKIVNHIRHKALNSRLFESLCEEMGSQYTHLLLHVDGKMAVEREDFNPTVYST